MNSEIISETLKSESKNVAMVGGRTLSSVLRGRQLGTCTLSRFRPLNPKTRCRPAIAKRRSPYRSLDRCPEVFSHSINNIGEKQIDYKNHSIQSQESK